MNAKKIALSALAAVATIGIAGAVYAQVVPQGPTRAEVQERAAAQFDRLDVNLDGQIDAADRAAGRTDADRAAFAAADGNADGSLSFEEFAAMRPPVMGMGGPGGRPGGPERGGPMHGGRGEGFGPGGGRPERMMGFIPSMLPAQGGDATITEAEFTSRILGFFDRADANNDDVMTREEAAAARSAMRAEAQAQRRRAASAPAPASGQ